MLSCHAGQHCNRRSFLRVGALGFGGLTLAELLRQEASGAMPRRGKSVIYVVLNGGPSHIDMYDVKPQAPAEYRGPFRPTATRLPGVQICEFMPLQAALMDRLALLRGIRSVENDHFLSEVYSGLPRTAGKRPAFGSIVSRMESRTGALPTYVSLNRPTTDQFEFEKPYFAGPQHGPFRPFGEALDDLKPVTNLPGLQDRKQLLTAFDAFRRATDARARTDGIDDFQRQAFDIITAPKVREAFDLSREPERNRARYGHGKYPHQTVKDIYYPWEAQQFLLARRLVEAGVRVVTLSVGAWDHHSADKGDIFHCLKLLLPCLDRSVHALVTDLESRGLDRDVLVVVLGEFGRTPKIGQPGPGREHWADAGCALVFGGGLRMGQVIGETDARAEQAKSGSTTFQNIIATIYHVLGVNVSVKLPDFNGRPQHLLDERAPIRDLVG